MAVTREPPTLADYVVTAISPALIMGLVGSLVFFLAEVLYAGKYEGRLLHTLFCFVFGIVLVARISIVVDATRSMIYGLFLVGAALVALEAFVDYPRDSAASKYSVVINAALMGIVWWCAYKLTWDCTFIDERRESSSRGLLAATGFEQRPQGLNRGAHVVAETPEERAQKPHTPGVTVVYFSLAALPIFGLGQSLIPAEDESRRRFTFWLAAVYVGSAMGLLLTTSFLGLRHYLRQRKLQMPASMTGVWLGLGAALVVGFLIVASILPRPYSETPVMGLDRLVSSDRRASKNAVMRDGAGRGEGRAGEQTTKGDGDATAKGGEPGGKGKTGDAKEGSGSEDGKKGASGNSGKGKDARGGGKGDAKDQAASKDAQESGGRESADQPKDGTSGQDSYQRFQNSGLGRAVEKLASVLKWVVFIVLALIVLAFIVRGALGRLAEFMPWAKRLLDALAAWWDRLRGRNVVTDMEVVEQQRRARHKPFSAFANPFADGSARGRPVAELVEYSFAALEAWAADNEMPRRGDETALEFAGRLQSAFPALDPEAQRLAGLVTRLAYAAGKLPANAPAALEASLDRMTEPRGAPVA
jgi:hypothetical protein